MPGLSEQRRGQCPLGSGVEQDDLLRIEGEPDPLADRGALAVRRAHAQPAGLGVDGHDLPRAHILDAEHLAAHDGVVGEPDMLRSDAEDELPAGRRCGGRGRRRPGRTAAPSRPRRRQAMKFMAGLPMNCATNMLRGRW